MGLIYCKNLLVPHDFSTLLLLLIIGSMYVFRIVSIFNEEEEEEEGEEKEENGEGEEQEETNRMNKRKHPASRSKSPVTHRFERHVG